MRPGDVFTIVIVGFAVVANFLGGLLALRDYRRKTPNRAAGLRMFGGFVAAGCFLIVLVLNVVRVTS